MLPSEENERCCNHSSCCNSTSCVVFSSEIYLALQRNLFTRVRFAVYPLYLQLSFCACYARFLGNKHFGNSLVALGNDNAVANLNVRKRVNYYCVDVMEVLL